ncbi:MAG: AMP-binding protein [Planctomycetaceae bacterium]|jgi:acyl-[acyl-carrier-protein]-phospholipid O-acyltransferase/long-chain-fatty-acid--[acyl-carrier-protein] ligase|nr:AMP-binding protein [Planctomycetaceae bacterium]
MPSLENFIPIRQVMRSCRSGKNTIKFADSTGISLTGGKTLLTTLIFRKVLHRLLAANEQNVGLLMPTSVYGVLANLALAMDRRTSVNLNYTFGIDTINYCIRHAEIRHVITSKKVLERFPNLKLDAELIVLEDLRKKITLFDYLTGFIDAYITPIRCLEWAFGLDEIKPDDLITIIFTSGSTGTPKGAMITQQNIAENVASFVLHLHLADKDLILGSLPLFHAYGYTTTMWLPAMTGVKGVYHFNPVDPKKVAEVARKFQCTAMPTTPTFLRSYLKRSQPEDFASVHTLICGAEKLPSDLIDAWEAKFGIRPAEGYGTTELSPVVSTNIPKGRRADYKNWLKEGTIGRPLNKLQVRIVEPQTGEILPLNTPGILQIKGPTVMKGYYKDPEKTEAVLKDGWYSTGDIATLDAEGFIKIVGRESRISKIGGEMVPHILVEDEITKIVAGVKMSDTGNSGDAGDAENEIMIAVSAVPDERKGERLIILHRELPLLPEEICKNLQAAGLPNLWIPYPNDFHKVETIPVLGTGKLDLRAVKELAAKAAGQNSCYSR